MALSRTPTATQANGVALLVKGDSSGLFSNFQRVPGLANFTLPDETGSTTETQLLDGAVATAQIAGVGSITGSIGAITAHPTHQWLAAKRRSGAQITVTIIRPAVSIQENKVAAVSNGADASTITFTGTDASNIAEGQLIGIGATGDTISGLVGYSASPQAADDHKFRAVVAVDPDNKKVKVAPNITSALTSAASNKYSLRNAGLAFEDILCSVNGFGDGDFQAGGQTQANISLTPVAVLTRKVEHRLLTEMSTSYDSVFADLS